MNKNTRLLERNLYRNKRLWFSIWAVLGFLLLQPLTAFGQLTTTVEVGKTKSRGFRREIDPNNLSIAVEHPSIAEARFDGNSNVIRITGINAGKTKVTVTGTFREILVGRRLEDRNRSFSEEIQVTVLPARRLIPDTRVVSLTVSKGGSRTWALHILLGPAFRNSNEEGIRWRNLSLQAPDNKIAKATKGPMRLTITGLARGKVTFVLKGQRSVPGGWQPVARTLEIRVS